MTTTMTSVGWWARRAIPILADMKTHALLLTLSLSACTTPEPPPVPKSPAVTAFWDAFHAQQYDKLATVRAGLEAEYAADPKDPEVTLLLGHANLWTLSEFGRNPVDPSQLPARATDALRFFGEARTLAAGDHRIDGWEGATKIAIGTFTNNPTFLADGQKQLDSGVQAFPEFNLFVRALINGQLPVADPAFAVGVDAMWETLDLCAGETVDRKNPNFGKYLSRVTVTGPQRVCWNGPKAAHNFEGFFLYMGDLVVKQNDVATAIKLYETTKVAAEYPTWPFRAELEQRIATAQQRATLHNDSDPMNDPPLSNQAATSCASCHARN
jgi:hypothetical protein